ncbi:preprotein translocase subunit YajC [Alicyclobacillus dauci]|uniref:Preprotein translocase subunit YajC n=1 Tax=Alicyclobacillus dauci TaxID=1475485 RepID=A0ABY6Z6B8_9BACL|nr:preprotein translocase subunit YajC [Alicyclobacillus dauci]WAH38427.1 preprotein translocase subunit YajC [Alicyclobacillus dauci]
MHANSLIFLVILVIVFYFLLILPQRRQQKKKTEMMKQVGPGAKIMTASGIYGEIAEMHDDIVVVRVAEGVELEMDQRAIVRVVSEGNGFGTNAPSHELGAPEHEDDDEEEYVDHEEEPAEDDDAEADADKRDHTSDASRQNEH